MSSCVVDGINIGYSLNGTDKRTIVFVHGNSSCKEAFLQQLDCADLRGFRTLALDLPGHGESEDATDPARSYTVPGYAALVQNFLTHMSIEKPILVGWSLGGHIVLEMIAQGSDARGVLITGTPPVGPGEECLVKGFLPFTFEAATNTENPTKEELDEYVAHLYGSLMPIPDIFYQAAKRAHGVARTVMAEHWVGSVSGMSHAELVGNSPIPIAVAQGENDPFVDKEYFGQLAWKNLWGGKVNIAEGFGHAVFLEDYDNFNAYLSDFANYSFSPLLNQQ